MSVGAWVHGSAGAWAYQLVCVWGTRWWDWEEGLGGGTGKRDWVVGLGGGT